jgi:hypothetical protein
LQVRKVNENRVTQLQKDFLLNEPLSLLKLTVSQDKGAYWFSLPWLAVGCIVRAW